MSKVDQTKLWHKKLGHASLSTISKVVKNEAGLGIPDIDLHNQVLYSDYQLDKQTKSSNKSTKKCYTNKVLELLHVDLMGLMQIESLDGKKYVFVCVNDFSRST